MLSSERSVILGDACTHFMSERGRYTVVVIGVPVRRNMSWREARKEKDVVVSTALDAYRRLYLQLGG